jgi:hypothetical protein
MDVLVATVNVGWTATVIQIIASRKPHHAVAAERVSTDMDAAVLSLAVGHVPRASADHVLLATTALEARFQSRRRPAQQKPIRI